MSDIILEVVRSIILLGIIVYLLNVGRGRAELSQKGWRLIIAGFLLLLFGSIVDITDNFESLNRFIVIGDTPTQAFLENMKESNVTLAGQSVLACVGDLVHAEEDRVTPPFYQATGVQIPLGPGEGSVRLYLSERKDIGQPHESQRSAILESLQVGK